MPITLSDDQVADLRRQLDEGRRNKEVADFANAIWNDPALSEEAKALAKRKFPETPIPDYDLRKEVFGRLDKERQERDEAAKKAKEDAERERYESQRSKVQRDYGFTDDAMTRMETEMNERRVYDYEAMAPYFASKEPKPIETTQSGHFWRHDKQDVFKQIAADPEDYAFNEIVKAIQTDDQQRRANR